MRKWIVCATLAPIVGLGGAGSAEETGGGSIAFAQAQMQRRYSRVPHKVLTFYYTWYGTPEHFGKWVHWKDIDTENRDIGTSLNYPTLGAYDSLDPEVIAGHIDMAKECGIDGFITTWWRQGGISDLAMPKLLDAAAERDFEVTIYWETVPEKPEARLEKAVDDLAYVLENYGGHPAFLKVNGKPVIFVYGRIMNTVESGEWPAIVSRVRQRYGKDFALIADGYKTPNARLFDGIHVYNIARPVSEKSPEEIRTWARGSFEGAVELARSQGKISCLTIIPGYNDTKNRTPGLNAERHDGQTYEVLWEEAIAADPDWVLITTWNEWHEGSEIEPSDEHGDKYIDITKRYAPQFTKKPFSDVKAPESSTGLSPEKAAELREIFRGKTIGVLPGFVNDVVFVLAEAGLDLKELSGEEILDPALFNPERLPVVVNAGDERYLQTVREKGDVDRALVQYLKSGGLLMALTNKPFPFWLNEQRESVNSAAKFGFPIRGQSPGTGPRGWVSPAEGLELVFEIDTNALAGLPLTAPFPNEGDLRWRPSVRDDLPGDAAYLPLATLKDQTGADYGDGIVYIEHTSGPLQGAKGLYVWMRMFDTLGAADLAYSVFRLAGQNTRE
jgi:glycoprotein endo-alpha-1,2-mannosidase